MFSQEFHPMPQTIKMQKSDKRIWAIKMSLFHPHDLVIQWRQLLLCYSLSLGFTSSNSRIE